MLRRKAAAHSRHGSGRKNKPRIVRHRTPVKEVIVREEHVSVSPEGARGYDEYDHASVGYGTDLPEEVPVDAVARA